MTTFLAFTVVGIAVGCIYALTATGLVVTYTTSGVFNFAHGAIGMFAAFVYWQLSDPIQGWGLPTPVALLLVLGVFAPLVGALIDRVLMRGLHGASTGAGLVVSLGLLLLLLGAAQTIWSATETRTLPEFFAGRQVKLFSINVTYHQLVTLLVTIGVAVGLRVFFSRSRSGVAMRAVVDDPDLVAMTGASPARVSMLSWALGSTLASVAGILLAPRVSMDAVILTLMVISGYAAAMAGRLKSLPLTFAGGLALGLFEAYATGYLPGDLLSRIRDAIPIIFLFVLLLLLPQARLRAGRPSAGYVPRIPPVRATLLAAGGFVVLAIVASGMLTGRYLTYGSKGLAVALILLSLVLLTGFGGQVSLCQLTFVGLGAVAMGKVAGGASPLGLVAAVVLAAGVGALVALPALRLQGLYLALSTMAFAQGMSVIFFKHEAVFGNGGRLSVGRLSIVAGNRAFFIFLAVVFAAAGVGLLALRRGPFGRRLAALDNSPAACATLGMSLTRTKLTVFALSAGLAGLGGALLGGLQGSFGTIDVEMFPSLVLLLVITIVGIRNVTAALLAGIGFALIPLLSEQIPQLRSLPYLLSGLGVFGVARYPAGSIGEIAQRFTQWQQRSRQAAPQPRTTVRREVESLAGASN